MTAPSEMRPGRWRVPECPWLIDYSPALFDEIRLAVVDAFFSIPRGGAEIGGILFGSHTETEVRISAFRPMECEHAFGPTFVLSEKDLARLERQLAAAAADPTLQGLEVVGWYHSHTRSAIFLSDKDLEIYNRFFGEPWQVALVMRPAGLKPTRAGFFFRERTGAIRSSDSYLEFIVGVPNDGAPRDNGRPDVAQTPPAPLPRPFSVNAGPVATGVPETTDGDEPAAEDSSLPPTPPSQTAMLQPVGSLPAGPAGDSAGPVEKRPAEFVPPAYMLLPEENQSRARLWLALGLLAGAGLFAYFTSGWWMKALSPKPPSLHLQALEMQGQLRILWDRAGLASQDVQSGVLEIIDGQATTAVPLDAAKIRAGSFQYARQSEMVEVHMTVRTAKGKSLEEFTSYIGQPPGQASAVEKQKEAAELAAEAERARVDLKKEELRSAELQRSLDQMRQTLRREEERRRVENQMPAENPRSATPASANAGPPPAATPPVSSQAPASPPAAKQTPPPPKPQPPPPATSQTVKPPATSPERPQPTRERADTGQAYPPPPAPLSPPQQSGSGSRPQITSPTPLPPPVQPLSGKWVYSAGSASGSPFPPETITLNLTETGGRVRGIFSGRYRVPKDSRFNGRVTFSFEGPVGRTSSKFPFTSSDGMKGDIEIIRLPGRQDAIEVVWRSERDKLTFDDLYFRLP